MTDFLVLAAILLAALAALPVLAVRELVALARGRRRGGRADRLRTVALLSGLGALAVYAWGALHLLGAVLTAEDGGTDSSPLIPCREGGIERALQVVDYDVGYLPLGFTCVRSTGDDYTVALPGYVNPAFAVLGLAAVASGILARAAAERADGRAPTADRTR
ncbi:hypothetical protein ACIRBX_04925 [Kitasatospora sp. NPDC096147]|uniref:hypothetical protein n=1 Tax=Kitasatospora sp. NPDC096147 TaxID=3364093 RepID=UPI003802D6FA